MTDQEAFDPKYWREKGYQAMRRRDLPGGLEALERARDLDPHDFDTLMALAIALSQSNEHHRALRVFFDLTERRPECVAGRINYALALQRVGYTHDAVEQFEYALRLDPRNTEARKRLIALGGKPPRDPAEDFVPEAKLVAEPVAAPLPAQPVAPPAEPLDALPAEDPEPIAPMPAIPVSGPAGSGDAAGWRYPRDLLLRPGEDFGGLACWRAEAAAPDLLVLTNSLGARYEFDGHHGEIRSAGMLDLRKRRDQVKDLLDVRFYAIDYEQTGEEECDTRWWFRATDEGRGLGAVPTHAKEATFMLRAAVHIAQALNLPLQFATPQRGTPELARLIRLLQRGRS